jgi:hypothetical protein
MEREVRFMVIDGPWIKVGNIANHYYKVMTRLIANPGNPSQPFSARPGQGLMRASGYATVLAASCAVDIARALA